MICIRTGKNNDVINEMIIVTKGDKAVEINRNELDETQGAKYDNFTSQFCVNVLTCIMMDTDIELTCFTNAESVSVDPYEVNYSEMNAETSSKVDAFVAMVEQY